LEVLSEEPACRGAYQPACRVGYVLSYHLLLF
jgi:hypothetical protein